MAKPGARTVGAEVLERTGGVPSRGPDSADQRIKWWGPLKRLNHAQNSMEESLQSVNALALDLSHEKDMVKEGVSLLLGRKR